MFLQLLNKSEELDNDILFDTILPFIINILADNSENKASKLFYTLTDVLSDFYDISPKLTSGL